MNDEEKQKHLKLKKKLKTIGIILIVIGAVCAIVGFAEFFITMSSMSGAPKLFFLLFIGLPMIGIGAGLLTFAYRGDILRFTKNEAVPIINETGEEIKPAIKAVTGAVREGLYGETPAAKKVIVCPACGKENQPENKFCDECGALLRKVCPACGAEQDGDDKFCGQCGAKLD